MIDNFWIFVTQLSSVLVYVGVAFGLYRLLAAQKDATIQAKDATIENLQTQLERADSKDPDIMVQRLQERLNATYKEIERLQNDKGSHSEELRKYKESMRVMEETAKTLLMRTRIRDFLLDEENENYKNFVIAICGDSERASQSILVSRTLDVLLSSLEKEVEETEKFTFTQEQKDRTIYGSISAKEQWRVYTDGVVELDSHARENLNKTHEKIRSELQKLEDSMKR
jgi:hypothetical protein